MATSKSARTVATNRLPTAKTTTARRKVRAIRAGFIYEERKRVGDVFWLVTTTHTFDRNVKEELVKVVDGKLVRSAIARKKGDIITRTPEDQFSEEWMEWVADRTPEQTTSSPQAFRKENEALLGHKRPNAGGNARDVNDEQGVDQTADDDDSVDPDPLGD